MRHTTIYAFNIFTGKTVRCNTYHSVLKETNTSFNTVKRLLKEGRPHYNSGWMFSYKPKKVWVKLDDLMNYPHKKPGYRDRLFAGEFYRIAPKQSRT